MLNRGNTMEFYSKHAKAQPVLCFGPKHEGLGERADSIFGFIRILVMRYKNAIKGFNAYIVFGSLYAKGSQGLSLLFRKNYRLFIPARGRRDHFICRTI